MLIRFGLGSVDIKPPLSANIFLSFLEQQDLKNVQTSNMLSAEPYDYLTLLLLGLYLQKQHCFKTWSLHEICNYHKFMKKQKIKIQMVVCYIGMILLWSSMVYLHMAV